jgi:hypothetical protein
MIPSKKSGEKRPQIDESSDKRKSSKIALKMTRKSKKKIREENHHNTEFFHTSRG